MNIGRFNSFQSVKSPQNLMSDKILFLLDISIGFGGTHLIDGELSAG